jgi:hypothetical protein
LVREIVCEREKRMVLADTMPQQHSLRICKDHEGLRSLCINAPFNTSPRELGGLRDAQRTLELLLKALSAVDLGGEGGLLLQREHLFHLQRELGLVVGIRQVLHHARQRPESVSQPS